MKIFHPALLLAFAFSSVSGVAAAAGAAQGSSGAAGSTMSDRELPSFSEVDEDNNTFIDAQEAEAAGIDIGAADSNYDGRLDRTEWERAAGNVPGSDEEAKKPSQQ